MTDTDQATVRLLESQLATVPVAGISFYQDVLGPLKPGYYDFAVTALFDHPDDPQAIAVCYHGQTIGFIPRDKVSLYREPVCRCQAFELQPIVKGEVYRSSSTGMNVVVLFLPTAEPIIPPLVAAAMVLPDPSERSRQPAGVAVYQSQEAVARAEYNHQLRDYLLAQEQQKRVVNPLVLVYTAAVVVVLIVLLLVATW